MTRDSTKQTLKDIGAKLQEERKNRNWNTAKIQALSDLDRTTINRIEDGTNPKLETFLEYCFALEIHPKEIIDLTMDVSPKIPPSDENKTTKFGYTAGVRQLIEDGFFASWRSTSHVRDALEKRFKAKDLESKNISSALAKLVRDELLIINREISPYLYMENKDMAKD